MRHPLVEEEVHVPVDRIDGDVEEVLDVVVGLTRPQVEAIEGVNPEGKGMNLECTGILVLRYGDHVFVKQLGDVNVILELFAVLAQRTAKSQMLHEVKDEFLLIFVVLKNLPVFDVLVVFHDQYLSQLSAQSDAVVHLFIVAVDITGRPNATDVAEDIKVAHIENVARHRCELDRLDIAAADALQRLEILDDISAVEQVFEELLRRNQVKVAVETVFLHQHIVGHSPTSDQQIFYLPLEQFRSHVRVAIARE